MPAYSSDYVATTDTTEAEVDLLLAAGLRLEGVVMDASTERPVEGALIRLTSADARARTAALWYVTPTATDSSGSFAVSELPQANYLIEVHAHGYLAEQQAVEINERTTHLTVRLTPADGKIEGIVENDMGARFAGARIHAVQGSTVSRTVRSRLDGSFLLGGLRRSRAIVAAGATGHVAARAEDVPVGTRDLRLVLETGVTAAGILRDKRGRPLPNTWINFAPSELSHVGTWVRTDSAGRFRRSGLPAGKHQISLRANGKRVSIGEAVLPDEDLVVSR